MYFNFHYFAFCEFSLAFPQRKLWWRKHLKVDIGGNTWTSPLYIKNPHPFKVIMRDSGHWLKMSLQHIPEQQFHRCFYVSIKSDLSKVICYLLDQKRRLGWCFSTSCDHWVTLTLKDWLYHIIKEKQKVPVALLVATMWLYCRQRWVITLPCSQRCIKLFQDELFAEMWDEYLMWEFVRSKSKIQYLKHQFSWSGF